MSARVVRYKRRNITPDKILEKHVESTEGVEVSLSNKSTPTLKSMTEEKVLKFFEAIDLGSGYDTACKYAGILPNTFQKWLSRAKEDIMSGKLDSPYVVFQEKLHKIEAEYEISLLKDVNAMLKERDPFITHVLKFLALKYPKKWSSQL